MIMYGEFDSIVARFRCNVISVVGNTDNSEGRGSHVDLGTFFDTPAGDVAARAVAHRKGPMGTDAPIKKYNAAVEVPLKISSSRDLNSAIDNLVASHAMNPEQRRIHAESMLDWDNAHVMNGSSPIRVINRDELKAEILSRLTPSERAFLQIELPE